MMDWTDRHCRYFHRLITRRTRLYTEMVTTGALIYGDQPRHLDFNAEEHPVALQLGGSERQDLALCAKLAQQWGYDEVNLNCGCPSERVQRGAFGACLMAEAPLVADCIKAMRDAVTIDVTVKHRIGIDRTESYDFVRDFVGTLASQSGCTVFVVHARNAWLKGISPKENRELPPLRYEFVYRLKRDFPALTFVLNGGLRELAHIDQQLTLVNENAGGVDAVVDGCMIGREAYHAPWSMHDWDQRYWGDTSTASETREAIERDMVTYMARQAPLPWQHIARHMLGLWNGTPGARRWRQVWSDHHLKNDHPDVVAQRATAARLGAVTAAA